MSKRRRSHRRPGAKKEAPSGPSALSLGLVLALIAGAAILARPGLRGLRGAAREAARHRDEIVVCGERVRIGTPVVLWSDPGGYDAYARHRRDKPEVVLPERPAAGCNTPERIGKRASVATAADLRAAITQFVVHYDECYTSRNCFHVLQDVRGLSVHFMLDLDGTIYQTCDLVERCRHARDANDRSIGVEIAHPGCFDDQPGVERRYVRDGGGVALTLPDWLGPEPVRTPGFVARPARPEPVRGTIQGRARTQYDFTDEQYEALARLVGTLARIFPRLELDAPRDPITQRVTTRAFASPEESAAFFGVVGHYHLTTDKTDPGPAFDWERMLAGARAARDARAR